MGLLGLILLLIILALLVIILAQSGHKIDGNKVLGILSYLYILCFIPLFTEKDNDFVHFHAKQGLVLLGFEFVFSIIFIGGWEAIPFLNMMYGPVIIGFIIMSLLGIKNVILGKKEELPLIGRLVRNLEFPRP